MISLNESEQQLLTTLNWFRSRYALYAGLDVDRRATKESIEAFGQMWIGKFKKDWTNGFDDLVDKEILEVIDGSFEFTNQGLVLKEKLARKSLFYQYEYDNYFNQEKNSKVHQEFCRQVYGEDLSQHGLITKEELNYLLEKLGHGRFAKILDAGCGNGKITELIQQRSGAQLYGIDISEQGIQIAKERTATNNDLFFEKMDMDHLDYSPNFFDGIISLDTFYYSKNQRNLLESLIRILQKGGRLFIYYSQWIMDESTSENLLGSKTNLAYHLDDLGLKYSYTDLTKSGLDHWKLKLKKLEEMKELFEVEGSLDLWRYRYLESKRYANWGDKKYSRYLYEISVD